MKKPVRRYSKSALKSAKMKANAFIRTEGNIASKIDGIRKEISDLEANGSTPHIVRIKANNLALLEGNAKRVKFSRVKAEAKYQMYLDKNTALDKIS